MKKSYQRPEIVFESFCLSKSIASGCYGIANNVDTLSCSVTLTTKLGTTISIFQHQPVCEREAQDNGSMVCYGAPSDETQIFNS